MPQERRYTVEPFPFTEDLEKFAPSFTPEVFTEEEKWLLKPFVTNLDRPVYVLQHLAEEAVGAIAAKESRSRGSLRRVFLNDYLLPIMHPESSKNWEKASESEKQEAYETRDKLKTTIDFMNTHGGIEAVVNIQRGRKFFKVWLVEYGDESIAEGVNVHLFLEGVSNIAAKEIEDKRIGISPIEKSTRYVTFADKKADGSYLYVVPGEIKGTLLEVEYRAAMDSFFDTYSELLEPYLDYIKTEFPKGEDETDSSFLKSRGAKRFDDLRELLPFSTQTDIALNGNTRAFEDLVNRLLGHPLGELRYWGQQILGELDKVVPSLVERAKSEKGARIQLYRKNMLALRAEMAKEIFLPFEMESVKEWSRLISSTPEADIEILSTFLFPEFSGYSLQQIRKAIKSKHPDDRAKYFDQMFKERALGRGELDRAGDRFNKVRRAFENAHYLFEIWARGGDYRDLQRHRMQTQERQRFGVSWGWDVEEEVTRFPGRDKIADAFEKSERLFRKLMKVSPDVAQYAVLLGFIQHWYVNITAREIYYMGELRTSPQARSHYKNVVLSLVDRAIGQDPMVFRGIMVDRNDYRLARRESEKNIEKKKNSLGQNF